MKRSLYLLTFLHPFQNLLPDLARNLIFMHSRIEPGTFRPPSGSAEMLRILRPLRPRFGSATLRSCRHPSAVNLRQTGTPVFSDRHPAAEVSVPGAQIESTRPLCESSKDHPVPREVLHGSKPCRAGTPMKRLTVLG